jgi:hypothetical protein
MGSRLSQELGCTTDFSALSKKSLAERLHVVALRIPRHLVCRSEVDEPDLRDGLLEEALRREDVDQRRWL